MGGNIVIGSDVAVGKVGVMHADIDVTFRGVNPELHITAPLTPMNVTSCSSCLLLTP